MSRDIIPILEGELAARERSPGLSMGDVLALPDPLDRLCRWIVRERQVSLVQVVEFLAGDEPLARRSMADLSDRGFVREVTVGEMTGYQAHLAPTRKRQVPLEPWQALSGKGEGEGEGRP